MVRSEVVRPTARRSYCRGDDRAGVSGRQDARDAAFLAAPIACGGPSRPRELCAGRRGDDVALMVQDITARRNPATGRPAGWDPCTPAGGARPGADGLLLRAGKKRYRRIVAAS